MSVNKKFYQHPKAVKARTLEPSSITLWLFANCYCRDHRQQGFISRDAALSLGSETEIKALVDSGLWREVAGGYQFWDWEDWNAEMQGSGPRSAAHRIVNTVLGDHPYAVQARLAVEVEKCIDEGVPKTAIVAGLKKWRGRQDAKVTWLPYFVSDAIREGESGVFAAIKEARKTGNVLLLNEFGYKWRSPDLPDGMRSRRAISEFMQQKKKAWLDDVEARVKNESSQ